MKLYFFIQRDMCIYLFHREVNQPILLFCEEVLHKYCEADEYITTCILTSEIRTLFPSSQVFKLSDNWKFVSLYSGATVPDSNRVPRHCSADSIFVKRIKLRFEKERLYYMKERKILQLKSKQMWNVFAAQKL